MNLLRMWMFVLVVGLTGCADKPVSKVDGPREEAANVDAAKPDAMAEGHLDLVKRTVGEWKTTTLIGNETVAQGTWSRQPTPTKGRFVSKATTDGQEGSVASTEEYDPGSRSWKTTSSASDGSHFMTLLRTGAENLKHHPRKVVFEVEITRTSPEGKVWSEKSTWTATLVNQDRMELLMTTKVNGDRPTETKMVFERKKQ